MVIDYNISAESIKGVMEFSIYSTVVFLAEFYLEPTNPFQEFLANFLWIALAVAAMAYAVKRCVRLYVEIKEVFYKKKK